MQIKDQIRALTKNTLDDLVHNKYEKLQQEKILTEETTIFLQEVFALQGTLTWPLDEASVDIDVYEMDDQSCFISEIRYLWFDDEESAVILFARLIQMQIKQRSLLL